MMNAVGKLFEIRPGELNMVALVGTLFALVQLGWSIGGSAGDALFFQRFGVDNLPYMYVLLGFLNFGVLVGYAACVGRWSKGIYFSGLFALCGVILLGERIAIGLNGHEVYAALWLTLNIAGLVLTTVLWSTAAEICDARQAKRLFPLFVSAGVAGWLVGSLLTGPLAHLLGTENLILLDAALLGGGVLVMRSISRHYFVPAPPGKGQANVVAELRSGFDFVRQSPLVQLLAFAAILFSILFFSVTFPFGKAVAASFSNAADIAGYLGLFSGIASGVTLLVALFVANRLYARLGLVLATLLLPLTYLFGFVTMAVSFTLFTASAVRFAQSIVLNGVADGGYNGLMNIVPPEKRVQVRAFIAGVPSQLGIVLSGVLLLLGSRVLTTLQIFGMGMMVAVACSVTVWGMRRRYGEALVAALREGRYDVFTEPNDALQGFQGDPGATAVVVRSLQDEKPTTRRLAAEMLGRMGATSAAPALVASLGDSDTDTRVEAIRALGVLGVPGTAEAVIGRLTDPQPAVRAAVLETLPSLYPFKQTEAVATALEGMLADEDTGMRVKAAGALMALRQPERAYPVLVQLLEDANAEVRAQSVMVLGQTADEEACMDAVIPMLEDEAPVVRRTACTALAGKPQAQSVEALIRRLDDPNATVRAAASDALRENPAATAPLLKVLQEGSGTAQEGALAALTKDRLEDTGALRSYAECQLGALKDARTRELAVPHTGRATRMLREQLEARVNSIEQRLVKVIGLLGNAGMMDLVAQCLQTNDPQIHGAAVEALEMLGDKQLVKKLVPWLEGAPAEAPEPKEEALQETLRQLMADPDRWVCALAARAAGELGWGGAEAQLHALAAQPDPLIQAAAQDARAQLEGLQKMKTLQTVSLMERVLLLHEVPFLAELEPNDLVKIAELAHEQLYPDGAVVCREGEPGNELYILVSGRMRVLKGNKNAETLIAIRETGDFFGEMAIFEAAPRFATVRAEGEARVLSLGGDSFITLLHDRPEVSLGVIRGMSRRMREHVQLAM